MARMAVQKGITGPLAGMLGSALSSAFGGFGAPNTSYAPDVSAFFDNGGYTGDGGRYDFAGFVHKGEGVLNQDEIRALGGESGFNRLRRALSGPGHSLGGMAGRPSLPQSAAQQVATMPPIVFNNYAPGIEVEERMSAGQLQFEIRQQVKREVSQQTPKIIAREQGDPTSRLSRQQGKSLAVSRRR